MAYLQRPGAPWRLEPLAALAMGLLAGLAFIGTGDVETKYKLAAVLALGGSAVLAAWPERKLACVVLWILIHPLSIEKVFPVDAAEGPQFDNPTIVMNASDGPLLLLAMFLIVESLATGRSLFRWSRLTTVLLVFLLWSVISYLVHRVYYADGFISSAPLTLLQDVRLLIFVLLIQSAVRTRADVIVVLFAVGATILFQTLIVGLSYTTGRLFNYAATSEPFPGDAGKLQTFDAPGADTVRRATGTMGQTNEQAMFHAFMTAPVIAFFVARNRIIRLLGLGVVAGSTLAIALTFSRGAWLAYPFGVGVMGIIAFRRGMMGRAAVITGNVLGCGALVAMLFLAKPMYQRVMYGDSGATDSRLRMLALAADLFRMDPLIGVGPGEFSEAAMRTYSPDFVPPQWVEPGDHIPYPPPQIGRVDVVQGIVNGERFRRPLPAHNKYMLTLSELGIVGLVIWLWFYVEFIRTGWRCARSPDRVLQLFGIAGVGCAAAQLVYMMLDLFAEDKPLEIMMFVPAFLVAASRCGEQPSARRAAP